MGLESILGKFWLRSKTVLFNLALSVLGLVLAIEPSLALLGPALGPQRHGIVLFVVGVIGILLRAATKTPIRAVSEAKAVQNHVDRTR